MELGLLNSDIRKDNDYVSPYKAFLLAENQAFSEETNVSCCKRCLRVNLFNKFLQRHGLIFVREALEEEYSLDFMRSEQNYTFLGIAGTINVLYTLYLMTLPLEASMHTLRKYAAIFDNPDNGENVFRIHAIFHGFIALALWTILTALGFVKKRKDKLRMFVALPAVALLYLMSLTLLFIETELTNLWDWQSGLANISLGNISLTTFTPDVTISSCGQNLSNGIHIRSDGCSYTFKSLSLYALVYGWVSGTTNSELFIANLWVCHAHVEYIHREYFVIHILHNIHHRICASLFEVCTCLIF